MARPSVKSLDRGNSGMLGGVTPLYAPPETFVGKISPFSDQYSLAIVYQEMLTGHRPFQAKNVRQLARVSRPPAIPKIQLRDLRIVCSFQHLTLFHSGRLLSPVTWL